MENDRNPESNQLNNAECRKMRLLRQSIFLAEKGRRTNGESYTVQEIRQMLDAKYRQVDNR